MGPKQTITYAWTAAMQSKSDRKLQQGELTDLVNYRRKKDGEFSKRLGNVKTDVTTFHGGTYDGPAAGMECCDAVLIRDEADQLFAVDGNNGEAYYRGADRRATPRWFEIENRSNNDEGTTKPLHVLVGDDLVELALGATDTDSGSAAYQLTVLDPITRTVKRETEIIPAANIVAYSATVDQNGQLWVGWVDGTDGRIKLHCYATVTAAPTLYDWVHLAGAAFVGIEIYADPAADWLYVFALAASDSAGDRVTGIYRSYGSTLTGAPDAEDYDTTTLTGGAGVWASSGPFLLEHDPADGFLYLAYTRNDTGDSTSAQLVLEKVAKLAPGTVVQTVLGAYAIADGMALAGASGYYDEDTGDRVVLATFANLFGSDGSFISKNNLTVDRFTYNGSTTEQTTVARSAWIASKPFQLDDRWYFLSGFDDGDNTGDYVDASNGVQNGFFVRDIDGTIIAPVMDGEGGFAFFGVPGSSGVHFGSPWSPHVVAPAVLSESLVAFPLLNIGLVRTRPGRTVALVDFAADYHSDVPGVLPGIAKIVGPSDTALELSPIHGPYSPPTFPFGYGSGPTLATVYVTFLYKVASSDNDEGRSFPWPVALTPYTFLGLTGDGITMRIPTLRHQLGSAVEIVIYGSEHLQSTLYRQASVLNDPTVDYVTVSIVPDSWIAKTEGEILYTQGGGLPSNAPEHARLVWQQGQRTMLGGTPSGDIWPSREKEAGLLPEYNAPSSFAWNQGTGELQAGCEVDANTSALFKIDAIAIATGNPDGRGAGGYTVDTVKGKWGCSEPGAVVRMQLGIVFPNATDGRMCLLAGGAVTPIHQGMEAYRGYSWVKGIDCPGERCVRWYASNGKRLVLDYSSMSIEDATPKWILEEGEGLPAAVGAQLIDGVATMLEAGDVDAAATWQPSAGITDEDFLDDGVEVLTDAVSGRMGLAGFLNEFDSDWVTFSSTWLGGDSTFEYSLIPDSGTPEVHPDVASEAADVAFRSACFRTRDLKVRVRETSATGEGRMFDGVAIDIRSYGRTKVPTRVIA